MSKRSKKILSDSVIYVLCYTILRYVSRAIERVLTLSLGVEAGAEHHKITDAGASCRVKVTPGSWAAEPME